MRMASPSRTLSPRLVGAALVTLSALIWSTAGVFTNGVATDAWGVIFWRGLAAAGFGGLVLILSGSLIAEIRAFRGPALLAAVVMTVGTTAFIPAFKLTGVANVALIYAAAPFFAAGMAWAFLGEAPTRRMVIASIAAFTGVGVIVSGSLDGSFGALSLWGDVLALVMTVMMASAMVVYRAWPDTPAVAPTALSSLMVMPVAAALGGAAVPPAADLWLIIAFAAVFAVASVLLMVGARRVPSGEAALLSALEAPFGPLLAWAILAETPASRTLIGGAVVFLAVVWSQLGQGARAENAKPAPDRCADA